MKKEQQELLIQENAVLKEFINKIRAWIEAQRDVYVYEFENDLLLESEYNEAICVFLKSAIENFNCYWDKYLKAINFLSQIEQVCDLDDDAESFSGEVIKFHKNKGGEDEKD